MPRSLKAKFAVTDSIATHGLTGFVLASGCRYSNQSSEGDIRCALIEADLVHCMVALLSIFLKR